MQPQILYSQQPFKSSHSQKARYWAQLTLAVCEVNKHSNHNPIFVTHLLVSELTTKSTQVLRASPLTFVSTHSLNTETHPSHSVHTTLHARVCTIFSLHMCSHTNTLCVHVFMPTCMHTHTHTHSYSVPYLTANPLSLGSVILNFNPQACFWTFTLGIHSWALWNLNMAVSKGF